MDFIKLKDAVSKKFAEMAKGAIYVVGIVPDLLWDTYIKSFPEGTNPLYRKRTEHDCSCCRQFIRGIGNIVTIKDGVVDTLWDLKIDEPGYQVVVDAMAALVKKRAVQNVFLTSLNTYGSKPNFSLDNPPVKHTHFHLTIPRNFIATGTDLGRRLSESRSGYDVFYRGLRELTPWAIDTVLELTAQGSLYRGQEFRSIVESFRALKAKFDSVDASVQANYVWEQLAFTDSVVARIRNSAIGTLLIDLSAGMELDKAVSKYESVVAPTNYRRPSALVTPAMVAAAKEKVQELNLTSALERRHATFDDLDAGNVIYFNRNAQPAQLESNPFVELAKEVIKPTAKTFAQVEEIGIEDFIKMVQAHPVSKIEAFVENKHAGNFATLVAPVNPTAERLFSWPNAYSWAYRGDVADSIKERVKAAGGDVTGEWCNRLAWSNADDLDFHMFGPGGMRIDYVTKRAHWGGRVIGELDVDTNGTGPHNSKDPVENIVFPRVDRLQEGRYTLKVNMYSNRATDQKGFEVEIDIKGEVWSFGMETSPRQGTFVTVAEFEVKQGEVKLLTDLSVKSKKSSVTWGLASNDWHEVSALIYSPNHWDAKVGNLHYLFMLKNCVSDAPVRGFFNEFLRSELHDHRKVMELVGSKTRVESSDRQLSGLGFSSTLRNELVVRVTGKFTRVVKVRF